MDTRDVKSDAGRSTRLMDDKDEHSDVLHPSPSTEALNTTSKDDEDDTHLVGEVVLWTMSDEMSIPPSSLEQRASDKREKNDEIAAAPKLLKVPVPQPSILDTPEEYFSNILELSRKVQTISSTANTLYPGFMLLVLKKLGMSKNIDEDWLTQMFHTSGYFDANGQLDREHFILFDSDFKFLESFKACIASSKKPGGTSDVGRLGKFFQILEAGRESGFKSSDFVNAFHALGMNLTNDGGDCLECYSELNIEDPPVQVFDGLPELFFTRDDLARTVYREKSKRRMILFVSMYTRLPKRNTPSSSHAESGNDA